MAKKKNAAEETDPSVLLAALADPATENKQDVRRQLSGILGFGAVACPVCQEPPHAMLRRPAVNGNLPVYEVACLAHGGAQRGDEPATAVRRWNEEVAKRGA